MDHYTVLGLNTNATKLQIKEAFKKLAMKFHPDKHTESSKSIQNQSISRFKRVSEAYEVLSDDSKRADYDSRFGLNGRGNRGGVGSTTASSTSSFYSCRSGDFDAFKERFRNRYRHGSGSVGGGGFDAVVRFLSSPVVLISIAFASALVATTFTNNRSERSCKMQSCRKSYEENAMEWPRKANVHQKYRGRRGYNQARPRHYYYNYPPRSDD